MEVPVSSSFQLVDVKVAQANFFLGKLARAADNAFEFHCYLTAFVGCCRSVTYALQAVMSETPGFAEWYGRKQKALQNSSVARYFHSVRNLDQHVGAIVIGSRVETPERFFKEVKYSFATENSEKMPAPPPTDVMSACHQYYDEIAQVVADCCGKFGIPIDPKVHFTQINFDSVGNSLGDALEEIVADRDAYFPELRGIDNQWLILRELVWSTELLQRFVVVKAGESDGRQDRQDGEWV
jgi:hypothetical protein